MGVYAIPVTFATPLVTSISFILASSSVAILLVVANNLLLRSAFRAKAQKTPRKPISGSGDCPYEYLLGIYGKHHFAGFVRKLSPSLESINPMKWNMILEIMDGIHFCLILVDDVMPASPMALNED